MKKTGFPLRLIFIVFFFQIVLYVLQIIQFISDNTNTAFDKFIENNATISKIIFVVGIASILSWAAFLGRCNAYLRDYYSLKSDFLYEPKLLKQIKFNANIAVLLTIIRILYIVVPDLLYSKNISKFTVFIHRELLPIIQLGVIEFWYKIIIGIIVPGIVGNFFYDLLKNKYLNKNERFKKLLQ